MSIEMDAATSLQKQRRREEAAASMRRLRSRRKLGAVPGDERAVAKRKKESEQRKRQRSELRARADGGDSEAQMKIDATLEKGRPYRKAMRDPGKAERVVKRVADALHVALERDRKAASRVAARAAKAEPLSI